MAQPIQHTHAEPLDAQTPPPGSRHRRVIIGLVVGAVLGIAYHYVIGCGTGTCPITARWWTAALYGGLVGFLTSRM